MSDDDKTMSSTAGDALNPIIASRPPQDPDEELGSYTLVINGLPHDMQLSKADAELYGATPIAMPKKVAKVVQPPATDKPVRGRRATGKAGQ